jgi:soluble epoxide hydrolase/lipid-phosphate phosphatase
MPSACKTYTNLIPSSLAGGYGDSSAPAEKRAYSLEVLVPELVEFATKLGVTKAVWIGHDWGCGLVNALAAHYPELFLGLVVMAVPYRSLELGLDFLKTLINREIYPHDQYEWGQFSYMRYYELHPEECVKSFEGEVEKITKVKYMRHDPSKYGQPAALSNCLKDGGWFGGHPEKLPDVPLENTLIDESLYRKLLKSYKDHGYYPPTAYYLNHDVNAEYAKSEKNGGVLEFPVLYIDPKHDAICSPSTTPKFQEVQSKVCHDLTYKTIESGHWVQLEKPKETNKAVAKWLQANF